MGLRHLEVRMTNNEDMHTHTKPCVHGAFEKFPDWFHYKTIKSAAVFVLLSVRSSYSPLSIDMISSVGLNIYMKI